MDLGEIEELTATTPEVLTEGNLVEMSASEPGPGDEKTTEKQRCQGATDIRQSAGGADHSGLPPTSFATGALLTRALKLQQTVEGTGPHRNIFREMKKQNVVP